MIFKVWPKAARAVVGAVGTVLVWTGAAWAYTPITPSAAAGAVVLTTRDLTVEQLVQIARYGAKVELSPSARALAKDNYGLLMQAAVEGVQVYAFTRSAGPNRETVAFTGDPMSPAIKAKLEQQQLRAFQNGPRAGAGPEIEDEATVRAMMAVRANTVAYDGSSPQVVQMLLGPCSTTASPRWSSRPAARWARTTSP